MKDSAILYKVAPKSSLKDDIKVLLDDYSVTTVSRFDKETMKPIGVQIKSGIYMTLHDSKVNGKDNLEFCEARKIAENEYAGGYVGFKYDWLEYMNHRDLLNNAIVAVGGDKLKNEEDDKYWTSTGFGGHISIVRYGGTAMYHDGCPKGEAHLRPFIAVNGE